jgi:hypothetical protein
LSLYGADVDAAAKKFAMSVHDKVFLCIHVVTSSIVFLYHLLLLPLVGNRRQKSS